MFYALIQKFLKMNIKLKPEAFILELLEKEFQTILELHYMYVDSRKNFINIKMEKYVNSHMAE